MKNRIGIISMYLGLFIAFIAVGVFSYQIGRENASLTGESGSPGVGIDSESGVFKRSDMALEYANIPVDEDHQRSMGTYYQNRAFYGAPPHIPHEVLDERNMGGKNCLKCHENGGFVEKFNAYAPVTPHPEYLNCRQCHVASKASDLFAGSDFKRGSAPTVGNNNALEGSPPYIPHTLHLRGNCLSCHAGPAAPKEIRVSHPERVNCRQCHVSPTELPAEFGTFTRKTQSDE